MSYTKTTWVNNSAPAINADNLNHIENGIEANDTAISNNSTSITNINNGRNYTSNEIDTGMKWINNKPIYRKVISGTSTSISSQTSRETTFGSSTNNVELFTKIEGVCRLMSGGSYRQFPITRVSNATVDNQIGIYLTGSGDNTDDIRVEIGSAYYDKSIDIYVIIEYIKTTD